MFNVCPRCGEYAEDKPIDPSGPFAICPFCRYHQPFVQLPLFIITGASGTGKSTVCLHLPPALPECVAMESDILAGQVVASLAENSSSPCHPYRNLWLRIAKNIGQGGRPVVLCGTVLPDQFAVCPERRYFSALHYLAFVCDDHVLVQRLRRRPGRRAVTADFIETMRQFNQWIREHASTTHPPMAVLDTSNGRIEESVDDTIRWVRGYLSPRNAPAELL